MKKAITFIVVCLFSFGVYATEFTGKYKSSKSTIQLKETSGAVSGFIQLNGERLTLSGKVDGDHLHLLVVNDKKEKIGDLVVKKTSAGIEVLSQKNMQDGYKLSATFSSVQE